uniref:Kinesin-like protein n=1 Tax=Timema monikensis TaxID=170555 RepID=A0A7R9EKW5_9NEOP|nr:unnamed protein product [Timema monikensis]
MLEKSVEKELEEEKLGWIQEEEERLVNMRESFQHLKEQLQQQQTMLDKREAFLKEKMCLEKSKTKSHMEMSARISHLEQVLKEKSIDLEKTENVDEKEALRHEIQNLRRTRDCLVDQRCNLDEKFQKSMGANNDLAHHHQHSPSHPSKLGDNWPEPVPSLLVLPLTSLVSAPDLASATNTKLEKVLNTLEERRLLECDEAIEAIDAAIEYKNELICGRKGKGLDNNLVQREKCEEMLLARLMKLSSIEVRTLLYKYFQKVIDLRESGKKMEIQLAELDHHTETQAWKIQAMGNALKQANLETERRIITLQREHEAKLHLMLRHFAEETSSSSGVEGVSRSHFILDSYAEVGKYKRENKNLKKRIQELEAVMQMACHCIRDIKFMEDDKPHLIGDTQTDREGNTKGEDSTQARQFVDIEFPPRFRTEANQPSTHTEDYIDSFDNTVEAYTPPSGGSGEDGDIFTTPNDMAPDVDMPQKKIGSSSSVQIPQQNLKRLQISSTPSTTKVTRQKNKLIIQQQKKS